MHAIEQALQCNRKTAESAQFNKCFKYYYHYRLTKKIYKVVSTVLHGVKNNHRMAMLWIQVLKQNIAELWNAFTSIIKKLVQLLQPTSPANRNRLIIFARQHPHVPLSNTWFLRPCKSASKHHLDRFSHFCRAHQCVQHRHIDYAVSKHEWE